ncbi:MAG: threonine synthase [Bacteroidales bacterium]
MKKLVSSISGITYPFERLQEFADNGESLEVQIADIAKARIKEDNSMLVRYSDFLPFSNPDNSLSMGEGNTPLIEASNNLKAFTGISGLYLKNETMNPTWSFKDRGSLTCILMAQAMNEPVTATISTGNMGNSMAAYGAHAGLKTIVFVPEHATKEKISAISLHGAMVVKVKGADYSEVKYRILDMAEDLNLRIVSGNGPVRVEGYKLSAFELFEQFERDVPEYIAVPTSACGHIRGIFKGFCELKEAGYIEKLPKMIIVQAENNAPIVKAIEENKSDVIPFENIETLAGAITTGNPKGGKEIIQKAGKFNWLAASVSEKEIIESQRLLARSGFFVEPASATSLAAVKKLKDKGKIEADAKTVLMLTGSGLKDSKILAYHHLQTYEYDIADIKSEISKWIRY